MTARPDPAANPPRSRRALLAGALGGLAAWAASAASRVNPTEAAAGDPIRMGHTNLAGGTSTELRTQTSKPAFRATQLGGGHALRGDAASGRAVMGVAGPNGTGVWGYSPDNYGVRGLTETGWAVDGYATGQSGIGVIGYSIRHIGVAGSSRNGKGIYAHSDFGIALYAQASQHYAGFIDGRLRVAKNQDFDQMQTPEAPTAPQARLFARGVSGKTQLCVRFPTGAVQVIAEEPDV